MRFLSPEEKAIQEKLNKAKVAIARAHEDVSSLLRPISDGLARLSALLGTEEAIAVVALIRQAQELVTFKAVATHVLTQLEQQGPKK